MTCVIETDDVGRLVLPPELLGYGKPHTRYVVEVGSKSLTLTEDEENAQTEQAIGYKNVDHETWMQEWRLLGQQIDAASRGEKSALQELIDMRNARE